MGNGIRVFTFVYVTVGILCINMCKGEYSKEIYQYMYKNIIGNIIGTHYTDTWYRINRIHFMVFSEHMFYNLLFGTYLVGIHIYIYVYTYIKNTD